MKEYKVKNISQMDINLGEIKVKIPVGKTVDLLKEVHITPYVIEREKDVKRSLGRRLKQKLLIEVVEEDGMEVIDRPTVFQAKSDEINFPNKVKTGIVMEERDNLLDSEIIQEEVEDVVPPEPVVESSDMVVMQGPEYPTSDDGEAPGELEPQSEGGSVAMVPEDDQAEGLKQVEEMVKSAKKAKKKTAIQRAEVADAEKVEEIAKLRKEPKEGKRVMKETVKGSIKRVRDVKTLDVGDGDIVAETNKTVVFMPKSDGEDEESYLDSDPVKEAQKKLQRGNAVRGVRGTSVMTAPEDTVDEQPEASKLVAVRRGNTIALVEEGQLESPQAKRVEENITLRTEAEVEDGRCNAKNRFNKRCNNKSLKHSEFCFVHDTQKKNS